MLNNIIYIDIFKHKEGKVFRFPMEEIVKLMVARQVPMDFEQEFFKAQALIARTQLVRKMRVFGGRGCSRYKNCDICDEEHCVDISDEEDLKEIWKGDYNKNRQDK